MLDKTLWERFLDTVEPHLPEYLHWNEICVSKVRVQSMEVLRKQRMLKYWSSWSRFFAGALKTLSC